MVFDLLILGLVRDVMVAISLSKKPDDSFPLMVRLIYICKTNSE